MAKSKKQKKVVVNRKFLTDLANLIYDPSTRDFLRLCNGTLQNGPDPTDEKRSMHCGLGELYFEMTGKQPKDDSVDEDDVVQLAVELSTLPVAGDVKDNAVKAIKALKLPEALTDKLIETTDEMDEDNLRSDAELTFREMLDAIPGINDDGCNDGSCSVKAYRQRSQRVAAKLRAAAKVLPA